MGGDDDQGKAGRVLITNAKAMIEPAIIFLPTAQNFFSEFLSSWLTTMRSLPSRQYMKIASFTVMRAILASKVRLVDIFRDIIAIIGVTSHTQLSLLQKR